MERRKILGSLPLAIGGAFALSTRSSLAQTQSSTVATVRDYGATGNGTTDDTAAFIAAGAAGVGVVPPGTYLIATTTNMNFPLDFLPGASLIVSADTTLTLSSGITANETQQIFSVTGTLNGLLKASVRWFGATGNGSTDDTAAIQKAINAVSTAEGGSLYLPTGTYNISAALSITTSNITLFGDGPNSTLISVTENTVGALNVSGSRCLYHSFQIIYPSQGISQPAIASMGAGTEFHSFVITNPFGGVYVTDGPAQFFHDFQISNHSSFGFQFANVNDVYLDQFIINAGNTTNGSLGALYFFERAQAIVVDNGDIILGSFSTYCNVAEYGFGTVPAYCRFTNVYFDSSANGASLNGCQDFTFTNCWFSNRPSDGCTIAASMVCDGMTFIGCTFANSGSHGCLVCPNAINTSFNSCKFISNNTQNSGCNGLSISPNTTDFVITNCIAYNGMDFTGLQGYGIFIGSGTSNNYVVTGNKTNGNSIGGIVDGGSGSSKIVASNVI
jgi:hypothetical protein